MGKRFHPTRSAGQPRTARAILVGIAAIATLCVCAGTMAQGIGPAVPEVSPAPDAPIAPAAPIGPGPSGDPLAQPQAGPRGDPGRRLPIPAIEATPLGTPAGRAAMGSPQQAGGPQSFPAASSMSFGRTFGALLLVVVLIFGLALVAKRLARRGGLMAQLGAGGRAPSGVLEVLGRFPAGRGCTLVLLKLDRRVLLVCQTTGKGFMGAHAMSTLCEITEPEQVASILVKVRDEQGESIAKRFQEVLARADEQTGRDLGDAEPAPRTPAREARRLLPAAPHELREIKDSRDARLVGPAQPLAAAKPRPPLTKAPVQPDRRAGPAAPAPRASVADPTVERVRGRLAALRGGASRTLEVRG